MYQKKKIALFISHIYGEYQTNLCQGVVEQAQEYGYRAEIYATNDGEDLGDYSKGETSILSIPNFTDLAGIIFASGTYFSPVLRDKIRRKLLKQKDCPVVEVTESPTEFPVVCMENNRTAGTLTEHLISAHQLKRICYLGIEEDNYFSRQRQKAFETAMGRNQLPVESWMIYHLCGLDDSAGYEEAFQQFREGQFEAVVCYNDEVALRFWTLAHDHGLEVPKDFAITGCDSSEQGQNITPPLTTVTFPTYQVGIAAVDLLMKQGKANAEQSTTVFAEPVYGGSCGCSYHRNALGFKYDNALNSRIRNLENSMFTSMKMAADFSHVTDLDAGMDLLEEYVNYIDGCKEFYLCLYNDWDNVTSSALSLAEENDPDYDLSGIDNDTLLLKLALRDGKRLPECSFSKTSLLPDYLQKNQTSSYVVCPLFFENHVFGYLAMSFADNRMGFQFKLVQWLMNITALLQNLCEAKHTQALAKHLESVYLRDTLTGLYNHHGFIQQEQILFDHCKEGDCLIAVLMDMDLLKSINDQFGHTEGDFAIRTIGQAIQQACESDDIGARFSGDEFYILLHGTKPERGDAFIENVMHYLSNFNALSSKPYTISISSGAHTIPFVKGITQSAIDAAFDCADEKMYAQKRSKNKTILR